MKNATPITHTAPTPAGLQQLTLCDNHFRSIDHGHRRRDQQRHRQPPSTHHHLRRRLPTRPAPLTLSPPWTREKQRRKNSTSSCIDCDDVHSRHSADNVRPLSSPHAPSTLLQYWSALQQITRYAKHASAVTMPGPSTTLLPGREGFQPADGHQHPGLPSWQLTRVHLTARPPPAKPRTPPGGHLFPVEE